MVATAPKIHGRFVGINYERSRHQLAGCINDARDWLDAWAPLLYSRGLLLESDATKTGIIRFVREALDRLEPGDWLVLSLSGHGTQVPDTSGDEHADLLDEAFCPYDMDKGLVYDDELQQLLAQRHPESNVLLIGDCCHGGTLARARFKQQVQPRCIPYRDLILGMTSHTQDRLRHRSVWPRTRAVAEGIYHLAGCADDEVSWDATFSGRSNGALSYYAIQSFKQLWRGATFWDWYQAIRRNLPSKKFSQTPQFNGQVSGTQEWWRVTLPGFEVLGPPPPAVSTVVTLPSDIAPFGDLRLICGDFESEPIKWRKRAA
jgi:hypothetical protein